MSDLIGNPIIPSLSLADPTLVLFGDLYWLYGTCQHPSIGTHPGLPRRFTAWSSPDLARWTYEGVILDLADIGWAGEQPWAPDIVQRNGRYYFYFCAESRIGVAVADHPAGPFLDALGEPLVPFSPDLSAIDPMIYTSADGNPWLYWGAVPGSWMRGKVPVVYDHLFAQRLSTDLQHLEGPIVSTVTCRADRHIEGSYVFNRGDRYYLLFSQGDWDQAGTPHDYRVEAAYAASPAGPWTWPVDGTILAGDPALSMFGPGHNSVLHLPWSDTWLIAYHQHNGDKVRYVNVDELVFTTDGTLKPIRPTREGISRQPIPVWMQVREPGPFRKSVPVTVGGDGVIRIRSREQVVGERRGSGPLELNLPPGFHRLIPEIDGRPGAPCDVDVVA